MQNLDLLIDSVDRRQPISFQYIKPGKTPGKRIGNVHAIFIMTRKDGTKSTKLHIVQTDGVSDSKDKSPLPTFRMFNIEDVSDIEIQEHLPQFVIRELDYNPEWKGYKDVLAKV